MGAACGRLHDPREGVEILQPRFRLADEVHDSHVLAVPEIELESQKARNIPPKVECYCLKAGR